MVFNPVVTAEYSSLLDDSGNPVKMSAKTFQYDYNGNVRVTNEYDWFDPNSVSRDAKGVPLSVPSNATLLKTTTNNFHNSPTDSNSQDVYAKTTNTIFNAVKDSSVGNSQTRFSYDSLAYGTAPIKGNVTQVSVWDSLTNQWLNSNSTYDTYGNIVTKTDPKGYTTQIFYEDNTHAMPTKTVADPLNGTGQQITTATYDFYTGAVMTSTDINGNTSSINYYNHLLGAIDPYARPGTTYSPYISVDGLNKRQTVKTYYEDAARKTRVESDLFNEGDQLVKTRESEDQLGRTILTEKNENGANTYTVFSETIYKTPERVVLKSNSHRSSAAATDGWTRVKSDTLGRVIETATFSGASQPPITGTNANLTGIAATAYSANAETTTDETEKKRRTIEDALGRLIRVDEPDENTNELGLVGSPVQATNYSYDALGNLTQIVQGGQTRSFSYSSLSRLLSATNPESGTFQYTYDNNGNLLTKIDARGVSTAYTYDALNRVTLRNYSEATPDISYIYDDPTVPFSKGKLTKVSSSVSETLYTAFDAEDNVLSSRQITDGQIYDFGYTYNLNGDLATQTYPSTKVIKYDYNADGDLAQVKNNLTQKIYANSLDYTAHGQIERLRLGNGKWETTKFNSSLQITEIGLGHSATDTGLWKTAYEYGEWESGAINPVKNNGNLARQTISVPTVGTATGFTAVQNYTYDKLDRLKTTIETVGGVEKWKQAFNYDRFGNKRFSPTGTTLLSSESNVPKIADPEILPTNNKYKADQDNDGINDYLYDASGNITKNAKDQTFTYDGENRQTTAIGNNLSTSYTYDGNDKRVKTFNFLTNQTTIFVYDASGDLAAEYTINTPPPTNPTVSYLTEDALGSVRIVTNSFGDVKARRDFLPFGEELFAGIGNRNITQKYFANADDTRKKFATYQRDVETGLDYAQSRYYSPMQGRFTSPDEFKGGPDELFDFEDDASDNPTFYADLENPQSLNKYQYTYNNPYKYNDPDGHCPFCVGVVAGAVLYILTNPDTIGKREKQSTAEAVGDLAGLIPIPGSKFVGRAIVRGIVRATTRTVIKETAKQTIKQTVKQTAKQTVKQKIIKGYTKHGLNQAIGRNGGRGVNAKTILNTVRNPNKVKLQTRNNRQAVQFKQGSGKNKSSVLIGDSGKVITVTGKARGSQIRPQGTSRKGGSGSAQRKANERGFSYNPNIVH